MSRFQAVCSNRPRPCVQNNHSKGQEWWRRDVHHLVAVGTKKTLCGRDASDWLMMDGLDLVGAVASHHCCTRCRRAYDEVSLDEPGDDGQQLQGEPHGQAQAD